MLRSARSASAGAATVTSTVALPRAGTVTLVLLNVTFAKESKNDGVNVFGPVASAGACPMS